MISTAIKLYQLSPSWGAVGCYAPCTEKCDSDNVHDFAEFGWVKLIGCEEDTASKIRLVYVVRSCQHSKAEPWYPACLLQSVESNNSLSGELAICGEVRNTQYRAVTSTNIRSDSRQFQWGGMNVTCRSAPFSFHFTSLKARWVTACLKDDHVFSNGL